MNTRYSLLATAILALATLAASGQPREITKEEFKGRERSAYSKLRDVSYRVRMTKKAARVAVSKDQGNLISEISEHVPPDRRKVVCVFQLSKGTRSEETIEVGKRKFTRTMTCLGWG